MLAASRKEFSGSSLRIRRGSVLKGGELGDKQPGKPGDSVPRGWHSASETRASDTQVIPV